jgi:hypothetical protein
VRQNSTLCKQLGEESITCALVWERRMDQLAPPFQLKKNCCELEKERVAQKKKRHHDDIDADPGTHTHTL